MNQPASYSTNRCLAWLLSLSLAFGTASAQVVIDFQKQHNFDQVKKSGVKLRSFEGDPGFYTIEATDLVLKLPGGQELRSKLQHGSFKVKDNGILSSLEIHGPVLPDDEAYQVALKIHQALGIPADRLEQWKLAIPGKGRDAPNFSHANKNYYPDLFFEMGDSMNPRYPWYMIIELGWNALSGDNRDESWGTANNPKPPPGLEQLSLDSPSGKTYDRKEAYAHLKKAQEELDRRLGQVRGGDGQLINPPPTPKAPEVRPAPTPSEEASSSTPWSIIVVLIVAATGLLWLLVKKRK
jgi:hypothetical protein